MCAMEHCFQYLCIRWLAMGLSSVSCARCSWCVRCVLVCVRACWLRQGGAEKAKKTLARALEAARSKLAAGEGMAGKYNWESAIDMFTAGLEVKGTHDEDLTVNR
jgi:hypothetical protein